MLAMSSAASQGRTLQSLADFVATKVLGLEVCLRLRVVTALTGDRGGSGVRFLFEDENVSTTPSTRFLLAVSADLSRVMSFIQEKDIVVLGGPLKLESHMAFEGGSFYPIVNLTASLFPALLVVALSHTEYRQCVVYEKTRQAWRLGRLDGSSEATSVLPLEDSVDLCGLVIGTIVTLVGAVVDFTAPRPTRGSDYCLTIAVADHSLKSTKHAITVNAFSKSVSDLPSFLPLGSIVKLKKIKIQEFQGNLQGLSSKGFECLVFAPEEKAWRKIRGSSLSPCLFFEEIRISRIAAWFSSSNGDIMPRSSARQRLVTADIVPDLYFDYVGEIALILPSENDSGDYLSIILTDYTSNASLRSLNFVNLPFAESKIYLMVTVWDNFVDAARLLVPGQIILLRNLHARCISGTDDLVAVLHGVQDSSSENSMSVLDPYTDEFGAIQRRKQLFTSQMSSAERSSSTEKGAIITAHCHKNVPLTTIYEVLTFRRCPSIFRCFVRVVGYFPLEVHKFTRRQCVSCKKSFARDCCSCMDCGNSLKWIFVFGLIAIDSTGKIPILVHGEEAQTFLGDFVPTDLLEDVVSRNSLICMLARFVSDVATSNGPFLDICIRSYPKANNADTIRYSLFDTMSEAEIVVLETSQDIVAWKNFAAGTIGGVLGVVVGHPLDTIKVRLQAVSSSHLYKGPLDCFLKIFKYEGVGGYFKGISSPLVGVAVVNAFLFGIYGTTLSYLEYSFPSKSGMSPCLGNVFIAGAVSGLFNSLISCPVELTKIICQNQIKSPKVGPLSVLISRLNTLGIRGCCVGAVATVIRETPSYAVYFSSYEFFCRSFSSNGSSSDCSNFQLMLAGGLSGTLGWVSTYPADVIKTVVQAQVLSTPAELKNRRYKSFFGTGRLLVKEYGWRFLFRGLDATIIRAFPTNAAIFLGYSVAMSKFQFGE